MNAQHAYMDLEIRIVDALKTVFDPEIPVNVYDLGLIYEVNKKEAGQVEIVMTLTNPNCPVAESLPNEVRDAVAGVEGVSGVSLRLVFEPEWNKDMMSDAALLEMGLL